MERGNGNPEANTGELHTHDPTCLKAPSTEGPEVQSATTATALAAVTMPANGCLPLVQPLRLAIAASLTQSVGQRAWTQTGVGESVGLIPRLPSRSADTTFPLGQILGSGGLCACPS